MRQVWDLYQEVLRAISPSARRFLNWYSLLLAILSILDAAALGMLALLIAPMSIGETATLPLIGELDQTGLLIAIAVLCTFIVLKGVAAVGVTFWATRQGAKYELAIGSRLFRAYIRAPWELRLTRNSSDIVRFTDSSTSVLVPGFLLPGATLLSEGLSLVAILLVVAIAQPVTAITTVIYLGIIAAVLYLWIARKSRLAGEVNLEFSLITSRLIFSMVASMKEITLRGKLEEVAETVDAARNRATRARANINFLGQVPRYALESGIIGGFVLVGLVGFWIGGITVAFTSVALFAVAGFRMAPAVVRAQSVLSQLTANSPHARAVLDEIYASEKASTEIDVVEQTPLAHEPRRLVFDEITFGYAGSARPALDKVSLEIEIGTTVAFVGPSGSGKTTIIDAILGLVQPQSGSIALDGRPLPEIASAWRKRLGYVPQDVSIFDGTVAENVALSWSGDYDEAKVNEALRKATLLETIQARPGGIEARVGERGLALSGGQRQRLGIARALYPEPYILVMDEATSALDAKTEAEVSEAITQLKGDTTLILVAHRLSTIMQADTIFYLREGRVIDQGTFGELVERVPDFAQQAELSGLT
jgi:ABC-type multidrug transport system fused ATPase/permease subunit